MIATFLLFGGIITSAATESYSSASDVTVSNPSNLPNTTTITNSDGSVEDTYQIELVPGQGTVTINWPDKLRQAWGSSYATSSEYLQLYYRGVAKAAGNVYSNLRIVEVCIWYTRDAVKISSKVCSNAYFSGGIWRSGVEASTTTWDALTWDGPKTIFNISTVRIPPNAIY